MIRPVGLLLLAVLGCSTGRVTDVPIEFNDNLRAAGKLSGGLLSLRLDVARGWWNAGDSTGGGAQVLAFGETGSAPSIPGPMIRVVAGTRIRLALRNRAIDSVTVLGLSAPSGGQIDQVALGPGEGRTVEFTANVPGNFFYWGTTTGSSLEKRTAEESQLYGALIVDSLGRVRGEDERVFVLGIWAVPVDSSGPEPWVPIDVMVINGRSWPHTERLTMARGEEARWIWLNSSAQSHPMHLHGHYFDVTSRGSWSGASAARGQGPTTVVTETLQPGETMAMRWTPTTPGNWLFHCHFAFHVSHYLSFDKVPDLTDAETMDGHDHSIHGMRGLVLGIVVTGDSSDLPRSAAPPRRLRLEVHRQQSAAQQPIQYQYRWSGDGVRPQAPGDSLPSPLVVLEQDQPVRVMIVNRLRAPTAVHWHGIELESYVDGAPGWSGKEGVVAGAIAPGDSFVATFVPPRAGTFIYHAHSNEAHQIGSGLYGPLIVAPPGGYDPAVERLVVVGGEPGSFTDGRVNGARAPAPMRITPGTPYRFRIISIHPEVSIRVSLRQADSVATWRILAKDGAEIDASLRVPTAADLVMGPGETVDVEVRLDRSNRYRLVTSGLPDLWTIDLPLQVRSLD